MSFCVRLKAVSSLSVAMELDNALFFYFFNYCNMTTIHVSNMTDCTLHFFSSQSTNYHNKTFLNY